MSVTAALQPIDNPLQTALDDYHRMAAEVMDVRARNHDLITENSKLVAEVGMLREALERADADRIRLQAVSSGLLGRLLSIRDVIEGSVKASLREGVEATKAASEPAVPAERVEVPTTASVTFQPPASLKPPQANELIQQVAWLDREPYQYRGAR